MLQITASREECLNQNKSALNDLTSDATNNLPNPKVVSCQFHEQWDSHLCTAGSLLS